MTDNTLDKEDKKIADLILKILGCVDRNRGLTEEEIYKFVDLIQTREKKMLEFVIGEDSNTHWSACNNHGKGRPNYKCVCGLERLNEYREQARQRAKEWRKKNG